MKIMVAEYAIGAGVPEFMLEGRAMLGVLAGSFASCGHEVIYPTAGVRLDVGKAIQAERFEEAIETISRDCDAALVIAPDELLGHLTEIVEENSVNLGCPSDSVRLCADKLECTNALLSENIPVPETLGFGDYSGDYVIKPRFGCASEGIHRSREGTLKEGDIATGFIEGEHLSVSLICGKTLLPLTVNKQLIEINHKISYKGGIVPYYCSRNGEIIEVAKKTVKTLGCRGYAGVDIVLADRPYVVDVNPRPTTSILGIAKVLDAQIADLILRARFGELPASVKVKGSFSFKKDDLAVLY
ncbi:MAG: ATP-grasp domain-containing protein [Candidatus Methanoperedens sp.]|nr:ATP-grasp domain-containing protein [Candidatus Methanoperedens sp.]MCZ7369425.1 ATP-grasp domain-containing protein [Candidatus Methanoperedens sp.]